jgi:large subunit ribosomal protein L14e
MALVEEGRVCIKKLGRDAGDKAVITKVIDKNFVDIVTASRVKDRRCNIKHLEFLSEKIDPKNKEQLAKSLEIEEKDLQKKPAEGKAAPPKSKK